MVRIAIPQMGTDLFRTYMKSKYTKSLQRAGAEAVWIDLSNEKEAILATLSCDGLLLPGGADLNPALYHQAPIPACGKPNALRDAVEWKLIEAFLPTKKPIFGICRGMQLLNVFFGGSLHQDISNATSCKHADFFHKNSGSHHVRIVPDTRVSCISAQQEILFVNSIHHQAVDQLGASLIATAYSEDGYVEAIELANHPYLLGVQWHPEHMSHKNPLQQAFFNAFVEAARNASRMQL